MSGSIESIGHACHKAVLLVIILTLLAAGESNACFSWNLPIIPPAHSLKSYENIKFILCIPPGVSKFAILSGNHSPKSAVEFHDIVDKRLTILPKIRSLAIPPYLSVRKQYAIIL